MFEEDPDYHIVAAGSLLGMAINRKQYSFPVGKVDELSLFPMDFEEFLWALGRENFVALIRACYESIPAQLAKENRKFQYLVVQRGGSSTIFGESIEWLKYAGVILKCQKLPSWELLPKTMWYRFLLQI